MCAAVACACSLGLLGVVPALWQTLRFVVSRHSCLWVAWLCRAALRDYAAGPGAGTPV